MKALWTPSFQTGQVAADCGQWRLDANGFCVADDARNGLEVGTKFRTSQEVWVTGVRIYRADPSTLRASLWHGDGTLLAQGAFADRDTNGWQDMSFSAPVRIVPGATYVASYFTPRTRYGFAYGYFADAGRTVGPVTATRAGAGDPNGVHCYDDAACGSFPVRGFRDSSYWVTPLWVGSDGTTAPPSPTPADPGGADAKAPRVATMVPSPGAGRVSRRVKVRATFSEAVRPSTLGPATIRLTRQGSPRRVPGRLRHDADRARVVFTPRAPLRGATTYRVRVGNGVRDLAGNRLDQDGGARGDQPATWQFRTRR